MGYTTAIGHIALRYLLVRIRTDLTYTEKLQGAAFFKKSLDALFSTHPQLRTWVCPHQLPAFCEALATHAYVTQHEETRDCFLWISFVYVVCICRHTSFDIGRNFPHMLSLHREIGVTQTAMFEFLHEVSNYVLRLHKDEYGAVLSAA